PYPLEFPETFRVIRCARLARNSRPRGQAARVRKIPDRGACVANERRRYASSVETERGWDVNGLRRGSYDSLVDIAPVDAPPLAPPARTPYTSPAPPASRTGAIPRRAEPRRRAPRHSRGGRVGRSAAQVVRAVAVVVAIAVIVWAGIELPPARYLIYAVWLLPLIEL